MSNNNNWKVVTQNKNNDDQYLIGFFNTQEMAYDNIPYLMRKYGNWIKDKDDLIVKRVDPEMILNPVATDYSHYCRIVGMCIVGKNRNIVFYPAVAKL